MTLMPKQYAQFPSTLNGSDWFSTNGSSSFHVVVFKTLLSLEIRIKFSIESKLKVTITFFRSSAESVKFKNHNVYCLLSVAKC